MTPEFISNCLPQNYTSRHVEPVMVNMSSCKLASCHVMVTIKKLVGYLIPQIWIRMPADLYEELRNHLWVPAMKSLKCKIRRIHQCIKYITHTQANLQGELCNDCNVMCVKNIKNWSCICAMKYHLITSITFHIYSGNTCLLFLVKFHFTS